MRRQPRCPRTSEPPARRRPLHRQAYLIVTALASQLIKSGYREDWPRLATQLEALYRVGELHGLAAPKAWQIEVDRADGR